MFINITHGFSLAFLYLFISDSVSVYLKDTNSESIIFGGSASCIRGRVPSPVGMDFSEAEGEGGVGSVDSEGAKSSPLGGVCSTSLRSLYLRCDMSTNPKIISSRSCFFIPGSKILILLSVVSKVM